MLVIRGRQVVLPDGPRSATLFVEHGVIARVAPFGVGVPADAELIDAGSLVVSPGIVDSHVHVNDPGRADWEGFETATRAAAAGGVTTIVDMPLNSVPPTTTVEGLAAKRDAARRRCHVDVAFWGGIVPANAADRAGIEALVAAGVRGFKCFLVPSGVEEFPAVAEAELRRALPVLADLQVPLLVHAEWLPDLSAAEGDPRHYATYLATRPAAAELHAIELMIRLAREFRVKTHIVHVSSSVSVDALAAARASGAPITAETCPHYLTMAAGEIPDGATLFKCAPPIREAAHRDALWEGLRNNILDLVATDHSPAPPALKCSGDFMRAWGGVASLELALGLVWTGARARGFGIADVARWMSARPAALAGLSHRKGTLAVGRDADIVLWDPDGGTEVDAERLQQRHKITPYAGRRLAGKVHATLVRGQRVWADNHLIGPAQGGLL